MFPNVYKDNEFLFRILTYIFVFLFADQAWVTLATNDSYSLGALVLAQSLRRVGTSRKLVVMITPGVTPAMRYVTSINISFVDDIHS